MSKSLADFIFRKLYLMVGSCLVVAACGRAPMGKITVDSRPQGAQVTLNGKVCPASPCDFEVAPGEYPVVATLFNYEHASDTVTVTRNGKTFKTLHLIPLVPTEDEARQLHLRKKPQKPGAAYQF